jgi:hypothetical protein
MCPRDVVEEAFELRTATGHPLRRLQQVHREIWAREAHHDLTSVQFAVLNILDEKPGIDQRMLGERRDGPLHHRRDRAQAHGEEVGRPVPRRRRCSTQTCCASPPPVMRAGVRHSLAPGG